MVRMLQAAFWLASELGFSLSQMKSSHSKQKVWPLSSAQAKMGQGFGHALGRDDPLHAPATLALGLLQIDPQLLGHGTDDLFVAAGQVGQTVETVQPRKGL
jgi:hypothetical protein